MNSPNSLRPLEQEFWQRYVASLAPESRPQMATVRAAPCGNREITDRLLGLYLSGKKWAGSSLVKDFHSAGEPLPRVGDFWIVLDGGDYPRCILRCERIEIHRFRSVPPEIARAEGEGDGSLAYWRQEHARFFSPYLSQWGIDDLEEAEVITEFFTLVFQW